MRGKYKIRDIKTTTCYDCILTGRSKTNLSAKQENHSNKTKQAERIQSHSLQTFVLTLGTENEERQKNHRKTLMSNGGCGGRKKDTQQQQQRRNITMTNTQQGKKKKKATVSASPERLRSLQYCVIVVRLGRP